MGEYTTVTHQMGIISFLNSPQCVYLVKEISGTRKRSEELQLFPFGDNFWMILDYAFIGLEIDLAVFRTQNALTRRIRLQKIHPKKVNTFPVW